MRAAILLAGGSSRRWGAANKLLARVGGEVLVVRALRRARLAPVGRVIVVVGAQAERVRGAVRAARMPGVTIVRARDHRLGIGASLGAGLAALWPAERAVLVFLGDMPVVPGSVSRRLRLRAGEDAVRPAHCGRPGHPVLLRRPTKAMMATLRDDRGLAPLLNGARTMPGPRGTILDLDRRTDRARLR